METQEEHLRKIAEAFQQSDPQELLKQIMGGAAEEFQQKRKKLRRMLILSIIGAVLATLVLGILIGKYIL